MSAPGGSGHDARRGLTAASLVVAGIALIGLLAGTREESYRPLVPERSQRTEREPQGAAKPARSYTELMTRPWGSDDPHGAQMAAALRVPGRTPLHADDPEAKAEALRERAAHRAFVGAPPSIPHPVGQNNGLECLTCHRGGAVVGQALAPPVSHELHVQCTQCHVPERAAVPPSAEPSFEVASVFEPLRGAPAASRWSVAPPQTPHGTWMRERCDACHGPYARDGLATSHPERQSCQQCHAAAAVLDQMPEDP